MNSASPQLQEKIKELINLTYKAYTNFPKCKSCGTCVKYCPLEIRKFNSNRKAITIRTTKSCGGCSVCYNRCPENAILLLPIKRN